MLDISLEVNVAVQRLFRLPKHSHSSTASFSVLWNHKLEELFFPPMKGYIVEHNYVVNSKLSQPVLMYMAT